MKLSTKAKDLTGQRFGSLTAIKPLRVHNRHVVWEFLCDCGNTHEVTGYSVVAHAKKSINPKAPSCGCVNKETTQSTHTKHGYYQHPLFWVWSQMLERCYNPDNCNYQKYGAVGVTVCDEWKEDAGVFIDWALANGWQKGLHLDKDVKCFEQNIHPKIYSPTTCQFLSPSDNSRQTTDYLTRICHN